MSTEREEALRQLGNMPGVSRALVEAIVRLWRGAFCDAHRDTLS
eukprot:SAG11_NODE_23213_length_393_cov_0.700680_1_plen_43_part_10